MIKFPVYRPYLSGNEKKYVSECLDSSWISSKGDFVNEFELRFSEYIGAEFASTVCNGTVALHLALLAIGIKPGDEVIVPTLTYIASVNAISYCGATPVFVDSKQESWQMDPADVLKKISSKTKAILCVHLYGQACEVDLLSQIAKENNLFLIEDCAEAIGTKIGMQHVGTFGDVATFSFYGNKTITTGEGGMVICKDIAMHKRIRKYRGQGLAEGREYWHDVIGYNYRMTNICAAIGMAQLEQIENILNLKRKIALQYENGFTASKYIFHKEEEGTTHSFWMCSILVEDTLNRDRLRQYLSNHKIETRPVFYPVHLMPMYASSMKNDTFENACSIAFRGINLPSYPSLKQDDINEILQIIHSFS